MNENTENKVHSGKETLLLLCILFIPSVVIQMITLTIALFVWGIILLCLCGILLLAIIGVMELIFGVTMVGIGIEKLFSMPMGAFAVMGFGFANIGIALMLECFVLWLFAILVPSFIRKITGREAKNEKTS